MEEEQRGEEKTLGKRDEREKEENTGILLREKTRKKERSTRKEVRRDGYG